MYTFSEPRNFVDDTDLEMESDWNTQYVPSSSESNSPQTLAEDGPVSPFSEFLYECSFCLSSHSPDVPCEKGHNNYTLQLPSSATYSYEKPLYVEDVPSQQNSFLESNYRKWLVSVTPR